MVKEVKREHVTKDDQCEADVILIDNSEVKPGLLAVVVIGVFGKEKIQLLKQHLGEPMVFFNLSITVYKGSTDIKHFADQVVKRPPVCSKTAALTNKKTVLSAATNTDLLTQMYWSQGKDVGGRQPLSCSAFLDYSTASPEADMPEVVQLMWLHVEEPEINKDVVHQDRVWYKIRARDVSGAIQVGMPQRNALSLASCNTVEEFLEKHASGQLNMPLLCHARVSRSIRPVNEDASTQGASDLTQGESSGSKRSLTIRTTGYVNYTVEEVEPVA